MITSTSLYRKIPQADLAKEGIRTQYANDLGKLADAIVPGLGTDGNIDVVRDFPWTLTPVGGPARAEAPYIILKEYYLLDSLINQSIAAYGLKIEPGANLTDIPATLFANLYSASLLGDQLYEGLYDLNDSGPNRNFTGFKYTLPFFSSDYLTTNNTWIAKPMYEEIIQLQKYLAQVGGGASGLGASIIKGAVTGATAAAVPAAGALLVPGVGIPVGVGAILAGAGIGAAKGLLNSADSAKVGAKLAEQAVAYKRLEQQLEIGLNSGVGKLGDPALDKPQVWSTTQPRTHNVSFPLFNTVDFASLVKNWELCHLLCYQNLYNKRNLFTGLPPVYYEITIPGVHYCKAGYISKLNISNIGNMHRIELPVGPGGTSLLVNIPDAYLVNLAINDFFIPSKNFLDVLTSDKSRVSSSATNFNNVIDTNKKEDESLKNTGSYSPTGPLAGYGTSFSPASLQ